MLRHTRPQKEREREKKEKSKEQSWRAIIIKRFNYYKACGQREVAFYFLATAAQIRPPSGRIKR